MADIYDQINRKIVTLQELAEIIPKLKREGRVVVQCHGVYDLFTPAHNYQFMQAKNLGDVLVVSITEDKYVNKGPGRPFFNELLRARQVAAQVAVDYVVINRNPSGIECIMAIKPNFFVKGESNKTNESSVDKGMALEIEAVRESGGDIFFTKELPYHSSEILNKFLPVFPEETQKWLNAFKKRYSSDLIISKLRELRDVRCFLIGEAIVDEYAYVKAMGKPTKGSHLAVDMINSEIQAGGILAAANHLAGFCKEVDVFACVGSDDKADSLKGLLKPNVNAHFFRRDGQTMVKRRYVERHNLVKLFQTYEGNVEPLSRLIEAGLKAELSRYLRNNKYDLSLVIDYGHGFLSQDIARFISGQSSWLALSVQSNTSNFGYNLITKYPEANFVCLDEPELRLAMGDQWGDVKSLAPRLKAEVQNDFEHIILTRGHNGCLIPAISESEQKEIPAFSTNVVDAVGAGDAFISITSPCVRLGMPLELAGFVGNATGALAVGTIGNRSSVEPMHLFNFINTLLK